ncbi:DUF4832 domain-containing protein [Oribacterium sp. KHPX15]|uniref:DUF4832 domain-containing protein n=1 Tax=Oribacterium sp. KHPX15 TaxID=1855342 RepID=UPI00158715A3|nr:DUF4832 domain-containing protein [Oribacterium sp. KHPX15]
MAKHKRLIQYIKILVLATAICLLMFYIKSKSNYNINATFSSDNTLYDNPLIGFAPMADEPDLCENSKFVYIKLTWADWEPEEGHYNIEGLEEMYNIQKWKSEHKHAVLRLICDIPGLESHMDIPEWLYSKTPTGTFYDTKMGKGYSPDYSDAVFREYHRKALEALAEYCNRDHFVSFVQLGSLGHWGEWHAKGNDGEHLMPGQDVCSEYAGLYSELFTNSICMTRRNYDFAIDLDMGVFNDMVGHSEDTAEWLDWLNNGGTQNTSGQELNFKPFSTIGLTRPVGGEFTSSVPMEEILGNGLGDVLQYVTTSRMTFIGPKVPDFTDKVNFAACDSILRRMGYRIYLSRLKMLYNYSSNTLNMSLSFRNSGNAGFYFDWPVTMVIFDKDKNRVFWQGLDLDLRTLSKDDDVTTTVSVPFSDKISDEFYVGIHVTDYDGTDNVTLAQFPAEDITYIDDVQIVYHYPDDNDKAKE